MRLSYSVFFISCLIPFVSPYPLNTDVQPLFFLSAVFILFASSRSGLFTKIEIFLLFSSAVFMLNFNFSDFPGYIYHLRKSVGLLMVVPVIWVASRFFDKLGFCSYLFVIIVYFIGAGLQVFFPSFYYAFGDLFFNNKIVHIGLRGWKSFTPEPINLAVTTIGIGILSYASYLAGTLTKKRFFLISTLSFLLALGTLSATAFFIVSILLVIYALAKLKPITLIPIFGISCFFYLCLPLIAEYFRPLHLLVTMLSDPMYVIGNSSLFYRFFHNIVALLYFVDNPSFLGLGTASFNEAAVYVTTNYDLTRWFPSRSQFLDDGQIVGFGLETKNMVAQLVIEHGLFGILTYTLFLIFIILNWVKNLTIYILVFFVLISIQSTPLVFPVTWLVLSANYFLYKKINL